MCFHRLLRNSVLDPATDCWIWIARRNKEGYPRLNIHCKRRKKTIKVYAHRMSYEEFIGPLREGMEVHHKCNNPYCINPAHLEEVTPKQNSEYRDLTLRKHRR